MKNNHRTMHDRDQTHARSRSRSYRATVKRGNKRKHRHRNIVWTRFLPALACAMLLVFGGVRLTMYISSSLRVKQDNAKLQALYEPQDTPSPASTAPAPTTVPTATPVPQILPAYQSVGNEIAADLQELYEKNPDLVGWLKIPDGVVSAPVVYRNNSYYLDHDFYKRKSVAGALFLDENHPLAADTQNLLIYGHNMHDGTMFGHFGRYRRESYWQENCFVRFSTLYAEEYYVIFAVVYTSTDPTSPAYVNFAGHPTFHTVREFDAYMEDLKAHSLHPWRIDVNASDALLTLATCLDDERIVLVARRARAGETMEGLTALLK